MKLQRQRIPFYFLLYIALILGDTTSVQSADATAYGWTFTGLREEIRSLACSADGQTIYSGTREGLYKSQDDGQSWTQIFIDATAEIRTIAVSKETPDKLYIGVLFASSEEKEGLFTSTDGGQTWSKIETGLGINFFMDIELDPNNEDIIYVGTGWGIIKSEDGGVTWHTRSNALEGETGDLPWVHKIIIDPNDSNTIYALTNNYLIHIPPWTVPPPLRNGKPERINATNNVTPGLFKISNTGLSWERLSLKDETEFHLPIDMAIAPENSQNFYVATFLGIYKTEDGGTTFLRILGDQIKYASTFQLAINPTNGAIYAGLSSEGIYVSFNQGQNWKETFNYPPPPRNTSGVYSILLSPGDNRRIYGGFGIGVFYKDLQENLKVIDFDESGEVSFQDFLLFAQHYGNAVDTISIEKRFDLDDNGQIDFEDFLLFIQNYNQ